MYKTVVNFKKLNITYWLKTKFSNFHYSMTKLRSKSSSTKSISRVHFPNFSCFSFALLKARNPQKSRSWTCWLRALEDFQVYSSSWSFQWHFFFCSRLIVWFVQLDWDPDWWEIENHFQFQCLQFFLQILIDHLQ